MYRLFRIAAVMAIGAIASLVSAAAATGPALLLEARVNMVAPLASPPKVDNFPQNKQNEPSITADPTTGALIAGSNDEIDEPLCHTTLAGTGSCPFAPNVGNSGVYFSTNGGATWTQPSFAESAAGTGSCLGRTIHTLPGYCEKNLESFGDPILAVGPARGSDGKFAWANGSVTYYGNLAFGASGAGVPAFAVSRSPDDGASWMAPVIASSSDNPVDFNDKSYVWADRNTSSPFFGNVYASWTLFIGAGRFGKSATFEPEPIVFARSTDGGETWSKLMRLSQSVNNGAVGGRQGSAIRSGPDGAVYVFWEGAISHHSEQLVAISHDGGDTFSGPMPVAAVNDVPSPLPGSSWRNNSFPGVDVNPVSGALYVSWPDWDTTSNPAKPTAVIKFTESHDGGMSWTPAMTIAGAIGFANLLYPAVAASTDGRHVFVAWPGQSWVAAGTKPGAGVVRQFAAARVQTDGVWDGFTLLSSAFGDPDGSSTNSLRAQFLGDYTAAVASSNAAYFVWTDSRNATPCAAVDAFRAGTGPKPNPDMACGPSATGQLFGNTDIFVAGVSF